MDKKEFQVKKTMPEPAIVLANPMGYCFGVKRAIDALEAALDRKASEPGGKVWAIGMPIHNPQEVERLCSRGLVVVESTADIPEGAQVFIRAHGEPESVYRELEGIGAKVIDATCPFVKRVQNRAKELAASGYEVVLLGDPDHPEVRSIIGHAGGPIRVVRNAEEAAGIRKVSKIGLISQTTQQEQTLAALAAALVDKAPELHVCNTICRATVERQEAVRKLAGQVDGLLVVGGRNSANTAKLHAIALSEGVDSFLLEKSEELEGGWLSGKGTIGVAAGASTPGWLIEKICYEVAKMQAG